MSPRLAGGSLRGRVVSAPPRGVRPTGARMREALFSIWGDRIPGCRFLDLFAGTGIMGLEAISRGASAALFIEGSARVAGRLAETVERLAGSRGSVRRGRLPGALSAPPAPFDLAFADPPYAFDAYEPLLAAVVPWLVPTGELAIEHSIRGEPGEGVGPLRRFDQRSWGDSAVSRYRLCSGSVR